MPESGMEMTLAYVVENIPVPDGLKAETGALAFFPDGRLVAGFWRGEIMVYDPDKHEWTMFANGFHNPLGIHVVNNSEIIVAHHPELTRVIDTDHDGEGDLFENITDDFGLSGNFNEFTYGPVEDSLGNLYISLNCAEGRMGAEVRGEINELGYRDKHKYSAVPYRGWVMKITEQGILVPFASGFRSPDGIAFDNKGNLLVVDQQGDWVGTSPLYHVEQGKFYGHPPSLVWRDGWKDGKPTDMPVSVLDSMRTRAAVLFPHGIIASSPTQPICDNTGGAFGPFEGQIFVGEMNSERIIRVMLEEVHGVLQGACVPFIDNQGLRKGNHRLAFAPDGSLWTGQNAHGWPGDEGIQRIRYTGNVPTEVKNVNLTENGFKFTFTQPMSDEVLDTANYDISSYYYNYHAKYGSDRYGIKDIQIVKISLSPDRKCVALELNPVEIDRVYQMKINNALSIKGDTLVNNLICYTINELK